MLLYALGFFALAALGGMVLANDVLRGNLASWALSLGHGLLGAAGLITLIVMLLNGAGGQRLVAALALLLVAALGGFFLASFHLRNKPAPGAVVVIHAGVAVIGFLTLLSLVI